MVEHQRASYWVSYRDNVNFLSSKLKLEVYKPNKNRTTWKQSEKYKSRNWWLEFNSERIEVTFGVNWGQIWGQRSFIHFSKYSRTLRSVENKEMELERKIQETDKVLREVQSLKVKYLHIWLIWYESYRWIIF